MTLQKVVGTGSAHFSLQNGHFQIGLPPKSRATLGRFPPNPPSPPRETPSLASRRSGAGARLAQTLSCPRRSDLSTRSGGASAHVDVHDLDGVVSVAEAV